MSKWRRKRPGSRRFDRSLAITLFTGLALLVVLGLVFSVAYGSQQITTSAGALHDADETLRSATISRAQLALAVHMSTVDRQFGTNSSEAQDLSVREARQALSDLASGVGHLYESDVVATEQLREEAEQLVALGRQVIVALEAGDVARARTLSESDFAGQFATLSGALVGLRNDLRESVAISDQFLGRIGNVARFLVAFFIPTAVILIYRELMRRQQRQRELETRLESERQLNAARERFIANASHELRTPLTSILGLAMVLAENEAVKHEPTAAELLDIIIGESDDLARMVEDLLTVARLDAGALHYSFDDVAVATEVAEITEPLQRAGMDITVFCEEALVRADRLRLRQVLRNLLSNARKYGGAKVRVEGRVDGKTFVCAVVDNGDGIPEEIVPRLFERFIHQGHQTASTESVGLGLSIVHALANGMGGSVRYERIGDETHFTLRVPLVGTTTEADEAPLLGAGPAAGTRHVPAPGSLEIAASTPLEGGDAT